FRRAWGNRRSRSASPPAPSDLLFEQRSRRRVQRIRLAQHRAQKIPLPETGRRVGEPEKALLGDTLRPKRVPPVPQILEHPALALKLGANHLGRKTRHRPLHGKSRPPDGAFERRIDRQDLGRAPFERGQEGREQLFLERGKLASAQAREKFGVVAL